MHLDCELQHSDYLLLHYLGFKCVMVLAQGTASIQILLLNGNHWSQLEQMKDFLSFYLEYCRAHWESVKVMAWVLPGS